MKRISSKDNPTFKEILRVAQGRRQSDESLVWLEGIHLSQAWLDRGYFIKYALFDELRLQDDVELQLLLKRVDAQSVLHLSPLLMQQLSQVQQGQGVGLVVSAPVYDESEDINQSCVYLDRIQDPGNVGTLLRTMAAAGVEHAYLSPGCAWVWSQKVLRSAQGAHFVLKIHEQMSAEKFIRRLTIPLYATALEQAQSLYQLEIPSQVAWVFGNEGEGVAASLLNAASERVFIPQVSTVESLNVGAAAAVCLFEQRRQQLQLKDAFI